MQYYTKFLRDDLRTEAFTKLVSVSSDIIALIKNRFDSFNYFEIKT